MLWGRNKKKAKTDHRRLGDLLWVGTEKRFGGRRRLPATVKQWRVRLLIACALLILIGAWGVWLELR